MNEQEIKPVLQDAKDWTLDFLELANKSQKMSDFVILKNKLDELTPEVESEVLRYLEGFKQYTSRWSDKDSGKEKTLKSISQLRQIIMEKFDFGIPYDLKG